MMVANGVPTSAKSSRANERQLSTSVDLMVDVNALAVTLATVDVAGMAVRVEDEEASEAVKMRGRSSIKRCGEQGGSSRIARVSKRVRGGARNSRSNEQDPALRGSRQERRPSRDRSGKSLGSLAA